MRRPGLSRSEPFRTLAWTVGGYVVIQSVLSQLNPELKGPWLLVLGAIGGVGTTGVQWGARRNQMDFAHWAAALAGSAGVLFVLGAALVFEPKPPAREQLTWAEKTHQAQRKLDQLRIGMTNEEVTEKLGQPSGRFSAPDNPFGIREELIYQDKLMLIQLLMSDARAVSYYAVTTIDGAFEARTPIELSDGGGDRERHLVLNRTKVGDFVRDYSTVFGLLGASYLNFGFVSGGGHAQNWAYEGVGLNAFAHQYWRGRPARDLSGYPNIGKSDSLYDAQQVLFEGPDESRTKYQRSEARRRAACERDLTEDEPLYPRARPIDRKWIVAACEDTTILNDEQQRQLRRSDAWKKYLRQGTVDTFAITSPHLFDRGIRVFYGIWDMGPLEESIT